MKKGDFKFFNCVLTKSVSTGEVHENTRKRTLYLSLRLYIYYNDNNALAAKSRLANAHRRAVSVNRFVCFSDGIHSSVLLKSFSVFFFSSPSLFFLSFLSPEEELVESDGGGARYPPSLYMA